MNYNELQNLIQKTAKSIKDQEKLPLSFLASKARQAAEQLSHDVPIINISHVLTKMASTQTFISRDELGKLVNVFATTSSKLNKLFEEEVSKEALQGPKTFQRSANEGTVSLADDYAKCSDPVLANALTSAFSTGQETIYSKADAQKAIKISEAQLASIGLKPKSMEVFAGRNEIIVCQASYDTPKGQSHVLVPVELKSGKALFPSLFLSQAGFQDINTENVEQHILCTAGKSLRVNGEKLLEILQQVKQGGAVPYAPTEVEMAVIKMASTKNHAVLDPSSSLYSTMQEEGPEVKLPKLTLTANDKNISKQFDRPEGQAQFIHGQRVVEAGRSAIVRKFADFGYRSAVQVKVAEFTEDKIIFAASIGNTTGVMIPVSTKDVRPQVLIAEGSLLAFDKETVDQLVKDNRGGDRRALAAASPSFEMTSANLFEVVKKAMAENNYAKAEDAINVLAEKDEDAHRVALAYFRSNICKAGIEPSKELQKKASQQVFEPVPLFNSYSVYFPTE